jgi:hypothetical protein
MAESLKIFPIRVQSGIKRDGTDTEGNYWNDGLWCRMYRGLPRSMGGYRSMSETYPDEPSRGLFAELNGTGFINLFSGSASKLVVGQFTTEGFGNTPVDITPAGFAASPNNVWQLDSFYNENGSLASDIIAHGAPNLAAIDSMVQAPIYYGDINGTSPLTAAVDDATPTPATVTVDGGIVSLQPYLIGYGSGGLVIWSALNQPNLFPAANAANVCATKIVKGLSIRGGSSSPSCLLWSLDSLIQMSFVGGDVIWQFNTISDQSSILSSSAVVEYDGIYYWPGIDRFLVFNGVLQELQNNLCLDFVYKNMNFNVRQKAFAFKIPRWHEIWFCFPLFGATECNWAVVYNVVEQTWYSTLLPADGRSTAYFAKIWQYPIMSSALGLLPIGQNSGSVFPVYQHEYGTDFIRGNQTLAIRSYAKSSDLAIVGGGLTAFGAPFIPGDSRWTQLCGFEHDYLFNNNLLMSIFTRTYAGDADALAAQVTIPKQASNNFFDTQIQGRYIRWQIEANEQGGYFIMGQPMMYFRPGDAQPM